VFAFGGKTCDDRTVRVRGLKRPHHFNGMARVSAMLLTAVQS
jgi:hypothetical protein